MCVSVLFIFSRIDDIQYGSAQFHAYVQILHTCTHVKSIHEMARDLFRLVQSMNFSNTIVALEHFKGQQLEDAVNCSQKLASPKPRKKDDDVSDSLSVTDEETRRLGEATDSVVELLEQMKQGISGVKEMRQRVRNRKDNNINITREMFATLRKAIDEREELTIADIKEGAYRTEKALEVISKLLYRICQINLILSRNSFLTSQLNQ